MLNQVERAVLPAPKGHAVFPTQLGLTPCFTPVASPESNGVAFAGSLEPMAFTRSPFVKTFKRDYVRVNLLPGAAHALEQIAGWIEDYNEIHPHSGLRMRSPHEFRHAQSTAEASALTGATPS